MPLFLELNFGMYLSDNILRYGQYFILYGTENLILIDNIFTYLRRSDRPVLAFHVKAKSLGLFMFSNYFALIMDLYLSNKLLVNNLLQLFKSVISVFVVYIIQSSV